MKENKGFTLIELLAVIVILAIIALIATPMILGVIETARKGAAESSALGYIDAVEKQVAINEADNTKGKLRDGIYDVSDLMNTEKNYGITVKGEAPTSGWLQIQDGVVSNYSFVVGDYVATKGVEVVKGAEAKNKPICIRATELHTEECNQTDATKYCSGAGYIEGNKGTTITYGTIVDGELKSGDALDCDVDGSGYNHRFYYVTELEEDNNYAVLIYNNNTKNGVANNKITISYDSSNQNVYGPVTAITYLPTKEQWGNVSLFSTIRTITNELGGTTTNNEANQMESFSYAGYAARLLTYQEVVSACGKIPTSSGGLDGCNYLLENTKYSNASGTYGYWLETPSSRGNGAYSLGVTYRNFGSGSTVSRAGGVRPAIEVLKSDISF